MADSRIFSQFSPEPVPFMDIGQLAHARQVRQTNELNLEQARRKAEAQRQADEAAAQEQQLLQQAFTQFRREDGMPDEDAIVKFLYPASRKLAESVQTSFTKLRKDAAEAQKSEWDNESKRSTEIAQIVNGATAEQWPSVMARVRAKDPNREIPQTFDPAWVEMTVREGTSVPEQNKLFKDMIDRSKDATTTMLGGLSASTTPAQWQTWLDYGRVERANPAVIQAVGETFSPEAARNAAALSMTPEKRAEMDAKAAADKALAEDRAADNRLQAATAAEAARHNRAMEARPVGGGTPIAIMGPDGKPIFTTPQGAIGQRPANVREQGPSTGVQKRVLNFFQRAEKAAQELDDIGPIAGAENAWNQTAGALPVVGNALSTEKGRRYLQAQRAFTEARLRKDSGAAIPPHEFESDRQTYFRQIGDDEATIAQKRRARSSLLASLAFESGAAFREFYGDDAETMLQKFKDESKDAPGAKAAPSVGSVVTIKGEKRRITKTYPDGSFDAEVVK